MEWQPTKTAPMKTPVLVWSARLGFMLATKEGTSVNWGDQWLLWSGDEYVTHHDGAPISVDPTHWMPLPAPPA